MNTSAHFPQVPLTVGMLKLDIRIDAMTGGSLVLRDSGGLFADELNQRKPEAIVRVIPDDTQDGLVPFDIVGETVTFRVVGILDYPA